MASDSSGLAKADTLRNMDGSRWWFVPVVTLSLVGCTAPNPRVCHDGVCLDPARPFCDVDGSFGGNADFCIAVSCPAMQFAACRGGDALICNSEGASYDIEACEFGCSDTSAGCNQCNPGTAACDGDTLVTCGASGTTSSSEVCRMGCLNDGTPHCAHLVPRYLADVCDLPATMGTMLVMNTSTIDTAFDTSCTGGIVTQTAAPSLCVARYTDFKIQVGVTLRAVGGSDPLIGGGRLLAIVTDGELAIDGVLDVSATGSSSGPGATLQSGGTLGPSFGQGGAGFKTAGGSGGDLTAVGGAMNGGAVATNPALLNAMVGGSRSSGGGGGGVLLISCRGTVSITGLGPVPDWS